MSRGFTALRTILRRPVTIEELCGRWRQVMDKKEEQVRKAIDPNIDFSGPVITTASYADQRVNRAMNKQEEVAFQHGMIHGYHHATHYMEAVLRGDEDLP